MTDADCTDDLALLTNPLAQAESILPDQQQVVGSIGLYILMCFKQEGTISTLSVKPLK